jgi:tripartite-type tricarboxylate transporter receptor subunit TctC
MNLGTSYRLTRRRAVTTLAAMLAAGTGPTLAQQWPSKPVKLVIPFPAGSGTDVIGRTIANYLAEALGQSFVVENRTGAGGVVGADAVAKAPADGHTLLLGQTIPNAIAPFTMEVPYKVDDFTPVAYLGHLHNVLVVPTSLGASTVAELVAIVKKSPGALSYSTSGPGSTHHISAIQFTSMHGLSMLNVPYRGSTQALPDMLAGQIALRFDTIPPVLGAIQAGRLKALAVSADQRLPVLAQTPTFKEAGIESVNTVNWYCLLGPKNLPRDIVQKLNGLVAKALADPQLISRLEPQGFTGATKTPEALGEFLATEQARFAKLAKELNISLKN